MIPVPARFRRPGVQYKPVPEPGSVEARVEKALAEIADPVEREILRPFYVAYAKGLHHTDPAEFDRIGEPVLARVVARKTELAKA